MSKEEELLNKAWQAADECHTLLAKSIVDMADYNPLSRQIIEIKRQIRKLINNTQTPQP